MELDRHTILPIERLTAACGGTLAAGAQLKAECGEDELDEVVPAGKVWHYHLKVDVTEEDA